MRKLFLTLLLVGFTMQNFAQNTGDDKLGAWYMYNGSHKLSEKYSIKSMAHFRFFDFGNDMQQFITRLAVNYKFNSTYNLTFGYAYLSTDTSYDLDGGDFNDHRIYTDFNAKYKISDLGIAHRVMYEQRFLATTTTQWIRYQLGFSYLLSDKWSTFLYDEIFFDFDGDNFNQNWLGAGFKYKASDAVKLKLGYQNIAVSGGTNFDRILVGIELSTDHSKKK